MNNRRNSDSSTNDPKQTENPPHACIKLGLDIHAVWIVVVRIIDGTAPQPAQKFTLETFLVWVKSQQRLAREVHSCYETGPFGYGLHRKLTALGVKNYVVQAICLDERHKGVNTDKTDARELALRLDRYVGGNSRAMAPVRVPTPEEEVRRAQARQREPEDLHVVSADADRMHFPTRPARKPSDVGTRRQQSVDNVQNLGPGDTTPRHQVPESRVAPRYGTGDDRCIQAGKGFGRGDERS